ncbi:MAG: hypothetical protein AAFU53_18440, partial [Cyanobacteria bacterium J06632_3]
GLTRLDLASSAVTGRCSNQLNYRPLEQVDEVSLPQGDLYCAESGALCQRLIFINFSAPTSG